MTAFYGIGVGVGDAKAVTIKAKEALGLIDILYVPTAKKGSVSVAHNIVKPYINTSLEIKQRHFPMNYEHDDLNDAWSTIAIEIEEDVKNGKNVGFVTIGDPMVYSTYIYLLKILKNKIKINTIPGITSFLDIASSENFPLVEGDNPLIIVPATIGIEKLEHYIKTETSLVIMKVYKNFTEVVDIIKKYNLEKHSIVVSNSSKDNKTVYRSYDNISPDDISYFTTILINKGWEN